MHPHTIADLLTPVAESPLPRDLVFDDQTGLADKPLWTPGEAADVVWELARGGAAITEGEVLRIRDGAPERIPLEAWMDPGDVPDPLPHHWRPWSQGWRRWFVDRAADEAWGAFCERSAGEAVRALRRLAGESRELRVDLGWVTPDELALFDLPLRIRLREERLLAEGGGPDRLSDSGPYRVLKAGRPAAGSYHGIAAPAAADDIPRDARYVRIARGTKDLARLRSRDRLETLWFGNPQEKQLQAIVELPALRHLHLSGSMLTSFEPVGRATGLESLTLVSDRRNRHPTPFAMLEALPALRYLSGRMSGLASLASLPAHPGLTTLRLETDRAESLAPVGALVGLRHLTVSDVQVADPSLRALAALRELRHLGLWWVGGVPLAEYARLAAALPRAEGTLRSPFQRPFPRMYQVPRCPACKGEMAHMLGRTRRTLCLACEPEAAMARQAEWELLRACTGW